MTTETQVDPQVVAWMRAYRRQNPDHGKGKGIREFIVAHSPDRTVRDIGISLSVLGRAWEAAKPPLTVADIPAGQGSASLFIGTAPDGCPVLTFKDADGDLVALEHGNPTTPSGRAFWEHLAATLPTVAEEA